MTDWGISSEMETARRKQWTNEFTMDLLMLIQDNQEAGMAPSETADQGIRTKHLDRQTAVAECSWRLKRLWKEKKQNTVTFFSP